MTVSSDNMWPLHGSCWWCSSLGFTRPWVPAHTGGFADGCELGRVTSVCSHGPWESIASPDEGCCSRVKTETHRSWTWRQIFVLPSPILTCLGSRSNERGRSLDSEAPLKGADWRKLGTFWNDNIVFHIQDPSGFCCRITDSSSKLKNILIKRDLVCMCSEILWSRLLQTPPAIKSLLNYVPFSQIDMFIKRSVSWMETVNCWRITSFLKRNWFCSEARKCKQVQQSYTTSHCQRSVLFLSANYCQDYNLCTACVFDFFYLWLLSPK